MKIKIIFCVILISTFYQVSNSQTDVSFNKYKLLAMLSLFSEGLNNSEVEVKQDKLNKFLSENVGISIIDQNSFKDFVFISINPSMERKYSDDKKMPIIWGDKECEEYILAINLGSLYTFKLKGYQINDFYSFLNFLRKSNYKKVNRRKSFSERYKVPGLDFDCLYKSLKIKKKEDLTKHPCITNTCLKVYTTHKG